MNVVQAWIDAQLGYVVDWGDTGSCLGAVMTAAAVFWAASLTRSAEARAAKAIRKQRYRVLAALYGEAAKLIRSIGEGVLMPTVDQFNDLLAALNTAPVLELGNEAAVLQLFQVKDSLISAREMLLDFDPMTWTEELSTACELDAKLCEKVAEAGRHAARIGSWPKPLGSGWIVFAGD